MIVVELACAEVVCARIVRAPGDADAAPDHVHRRQLLFERDCLGELSLVIEGWVETIEVCRGQRRVLELNEHGPLPRTVNGTGQKGEVAAANPDGSVRDCDK